MGTPPIISNDAAGIRRSRRLKVDFPIKVFAVQGRRRTVLQGRSHDLSQEGMAIYIPAELAIGQIVQIEFCLPFSQQRLGVTGMVKDSEGFRCGVEFQDLTPKEQIELARSCEKLVETL
jgi:c-di-GMP-binding flagellar brake protein YcgR